jgi:hypothetical protein
MESAGADEAALARRIMAVAPSRDRDAEGELYRRLAPRVRGHGGPARLENVPFNAEAGEVIFAPGAAYLRTLDTLTQCLELVAVVEADQRVIGKYTFNHHRYPG